MSLKDAIRTAAQEQKRQGDRKELSQNAVKLENQHKLIPENQRDAELVNLTIRVTKGQRRHWGIEAKKRDTSLTASIIEALNARFGEPADG